MAHDLKTDINKATDHLKTQLAKLQIGRASTMLVEDIQVEAYGSKIALKGAANISVPDAQTLRIEPWDKAIMADIEKGIIAANVGLNPTNMGEHLLISVPPLTEERRKQLTKTVHTEVEVARVSIRNARHEALKTTKRLKDEKEISEDEAKKMDKEVQEIVDKANTEVAEIGKKKETDILTV